MCLHYKQTLITIARQYMIEKLAFSLGRNDEEPNSELAQKLAKTKNLKGIKEIIDGLNNQK